MKILVNLSRMDGVSKEVYEIESIVTFSRTRNRFFLSWQGYPPTSNTWEPFKSFSEKETPFFFLSKLPGGSAPDRDSSQSALNKINF